MSGPRIPFAVVATAVLALGVSACQGNVAPPPPPPQYGTTPPPHRTPSPVPTPSESAPSATGDIPIYQPSSVVTRTGGSTVLTSPDPVGKVSGFYLDAVNSGGWNSVSKSITQDSTTITVHKPGRGAAITISSDSNSGRTLITIASYPS